MILGDSKLAPLVEGGHIGNGSVDMSLHDQWMKPIWHGLRPFIVGQDEMPYEVVTGNLVLLPRQFALCRTREKVTLPTEVAGWVEGRSSIGRLGIWVQNAGYVDPGFEGTITLEVYNGNDFSIMIPSSYRICQLVAALTDGVTFAYNGKYQGQIDCEGFKNDR